jgi:acyl-coenzyme A thioesterase PaaI-like protein
MKLKKIYDVLAPLPLGTWLVTRCFSLAAPYSGTVKPHIIELRDGFCHVSIKDRRRIRNHLRSVHAIALMNLGEMITGLPLTYTLPENARAILTHMEMDYKKKARGELHGYCRFKLEKEDYEQEDIELTGEIKDKQGDTVAVSRAIWRVDTTKNKS